MTGQLGMAPELQDTVAYNASKGGVDALTREALAWADAAESVGVSVKRVRYVAVAISGMLAGLGGVYLALDQHQFTDQMTAGRGFIAVAAVIFGRWDPVRAALACLLFAAALCWPPAAIE